jgi:hypothetical protein
LNIELITCYHTQERKSKKHNSFAFTFRRFVSSFKIENSTTRLEAKGNGNPTTFALVFQIL